MELLFVTAVFHGFGALVCGMIVYNIGRYHSNKNKPRTYRVILMGGTILIFLNFLRFISASSKLKVLNVLSGFLTVLYFIILALTMVFFVLYTFKFLRYSLPFCGGLMGRIMDGAARVLSAIAVIVFAVLDSTQILPLAVIMFYLFGMYLDCQNELISLDPLTRLNNRNEFYSYLWHRLSTPLRGRVCLLMMDMNSFKAINDTFGHDEGDQALIRVASCLRKACGGVMGRPFIARFGGDEFIIVMETDSDEEVDRLCDCINMTLAVENHSSRSPYELSISIGWVRNEQGNRSVRSLIRRADSVLYVNKRLKKERERSA
ncbi:GGDEF domain-containing protein [Butyrivibrio sp. MC2013]|uniref:GGDEF domain-containing protein n=1 Tax=Butyrivibrio sp. MC2013 TaxID=1280686 RepID=UPI00040EB89C|nr:GGDEF domain-containing protein [Butyrivibrio sp. MC2013]